MGPLSESFSQAIEDESQMSSPAISVSISAPAQATKLNEEESLLSDLNNYIPLGSLLATLLLEDGPGLLGQWAEIDAPALSVYFVLDTRLRDSIGKLIRARWIRVQAMTPTRTFGSDNNAIIRLYVLPHDVGRRFVDRKIRRLHAALEHIVQVVTISADVWNGDCTQTGELFDPWPAAEDSSLFYLFNTLPSPSPSPHTVRDPYAKAAMQELLDMRLPGLNARLYPFQARAAAMMLQREATQELFLDPRLEVRQAPNGHQFFYSPRDAEFLQNPRLFESNRSGILAEGMGRGKTIIALSLILATKHHLPRIPPAYQTGPPVRKYVGSLVEMAAAAAGRHSVPWKAVLDRHEQETGEVLTACIKELSNNPPRYEIPAQVLRFNRKTSVPPARRLTMCGGTIVVVPRNLLHQWQSELRKHVKEASLNVLVMDNTGKELPPAPELATFDLVLFSRTRFEFEIRDGADNLGRRDSHNSPTVCRCPYIGSTRIRDCSCLKQDSFYVSPLKHLHWLRIMIDEGHSFSSATSNAVLVAQNLVQVERRWVISGTPAKDDLLEVEVDLASNQSFSVEADDQLMRDMILDQRKRFDGEDSSGAARSLGALATHFLQIRPWAEANSEQRADWMEHIYRHEGFKKRTFTAFSKCMTKTLEQLIIKTQQFDVERDIILPPLTHRVVRLDPSYYDKLTANLFILVLTANAVTSERTDIDYLFHPKSQKARNQLITNLRQSNFFWTGLNEADVGNSVENGCRYLVKKNARCSEEDRQLLTDCMKFAEDIVLSSANWKAMSATHEIGMFVDSWPGNSSTWALGKDPPELYGVTQLLQAQAYVNERLQDNPTEGLDAAGTAAVAQAYAAEDSIESKEAKRGEEMKMGLPSSSVHAEVNIAKLHGAGASKKPGSTPKKVVSTKGSGQRKGSGPAAKKTRGEEEITPSKSPRKRSRIDGGLQLQADSPLRDTRLIGTVSAKLSYLLGQVMTYYEDEKILIFYDGDNAAFYLAQCLDLLHIKHEIYAKGLSNQMRSRYIVNFDKDPTLRVLLMDVRLGALGLNVNQASRVYFINPVCRPSIEAQAVKRAHRIGQTKPVHVETLILRGTIEEAMFERSKAMTRHEHLEAKTLEDDQKITDIIKGARLLPIAPDEAAGERQMAPLARPEQLFGRPGRVAPPPRASGAGAGAGAGADQSPASPKRRRKRARVDVEGHQSSRAVAMAVDSPPPQVPASAIMPPPPSIFGGPSVAPFAQRPLR